MYISGNLKHIFDTQTLGSNGFRKREVVVETEEQYPQTILIEFVQDKTDILDKFVEGQNVKISINIKGREWINPQGESKYFNSIQGWKVESLGVSNSGKKQQPPLPPVDEFDPIDDLDDNDQDDLRF